MISPGPCTPNEAGISVPLIRRFAGEIPMLGVCLGHQSDRSGVRRQDRARQAADAWQGLDHSSRRSRACSADCRTAFEATRYHSLVIERESLPAALEVTAWTDDGEIMGVQHKSCRSRASSSIPSRS